MRISIEEAKKSIGKEVEIAGFVHKFINMGKLKFLLIRDRSGIIQLVAKKDLIDENLFNSIDVNREDVVLVKGKVIENKSAPFGVEVIPYSFEVLNKVLDKLPIDPSEEVKADFDTSLNYRYLDLRRKKIFSIFKLKSIVVNHFRNFLLENGFIEIHTPSIIAAASEGGAEVFEVQYFENKAYLAQSPQLYKQLAIIGGLEKVFSTQTVFRAEKHNTTTHLNEVFQMDVEIGFATHMEAMDWLEKVFISILERVNKEQDLLKEIGSNINLLNSIPRYTYTEIIKLLQNEGIDIEWGRDFTKEEEKKIFELVGKEAFFIYNWPQEVRAFYSMPNDDGTCRAFDFIYRGLEISSGAQRIHQYSLLKESIKKKGLNVDSFKFYLDAFKFGAPPHAGWSIGLERLIIKLCNLNNIRDAVLWPRDRTRLVP